MANIDRLRGCGTAIITPFKQDESIDESAFRRLVDFQVENGVDFIVACGTTGESVTMSDDEQARVVELTVEASEGRAPVVAGAGGYNTREVIEKVHRYERLGAGAVLAVTGEAGGGHVDSGLRSHVRSANPIVDSLLDSLLSGVVVVGHNAVMTSSSALDLIHASPGEGVPHQHRR